MNEPRTLRLVEKKVAIWLCEACGKHVTLSWPNELPKDCQCGGVCWTKVLVRKKEKQDEAGS